MKAGIYFYIHLKSEIMSAQNQNNNQKKESKSKAATEKTPRTNADKSKETPHKK